ncbi:MAG TPA: mechanosensitive ion channel domain-containing protein [Nitrososphaerales archaeon]|nr:mechanosensitive ion channel domain-containing protein [Nitrososphaerales archaeon]
MTNPLMDISIVAAITVIGVGIFVAEEILSFVIRRIARRAGAGPTVTRDIGASLRIIAIAFILSDVLSFSGLSSLFTGLTVSAVVAVAVSLALQTTLSNVISGLLLFSDGVLRLHDTIEYNGAKGEVVRIGLRNTWVKTKEGHIAVIGNTSLSGGPLTNHSAAERLSKKYAIPMGQVAQPLLGPELVGGERKVGDVDEDAGHPLEQG